MEHLANSKSNFRKCSFVLFVCNVFLFYIICIYVYVYVCLYTVCHHIFVHAKVRDMEGNGIAKTFWNGYSFNWNWMKWMKGRTFCILLALDIIKISIVLSIVNMMEDLLSIVRYYIFSFSSRFFGCEMCFAFSFELTGMGSITSNGELGKRNLHLSTNELCNVSTILRPASVHCN